MRLFQAGQQGVAQLQLVFDQSGQPLQGVTLLVVEGAWPLIDDAEGADQGALGAGNRHAGIEADAGVTGDQRVARKARIKGGVGYFHQCRLAYCVGTEGHFLRCFAGVQTDPALEPLALAINQRDQCDRSVQPACSQRRQVVEGLLAGGIHDVQRCQCGQTLLLVAVAIVHAGSARLTSCVSLDSFPVCIGVLAWQPNPES